jgi:hypothetical protein
VNDALRIKVIRSGFVVHPDYGIITKEHSLRLQAFRQWWGMPV